MRYTPSRKAAQALGLHPNTLRKYADEGRIKAIKTASGQRRYDVDSYIRDTGDPALVCYCRVSSSKQRDDLQRQVQFMRDQYPGADIITDVGGGLNWRRKGLASLFGDDDVPKSSHSFYLQVWRQTSLLEHAPCGCPIQPVLSVPLRESELIYLDVYVK